MKELTKDRVELYFSYAPKTGHLITKLRPESDFKTDAAYKIHRSFVGKIAGGETATGYVSVRIDGKTYLAHRVIWLLVHGQLPPHREVEIDHINGIRYDNRISNLRLVTRKQNLRNSGKSARNKSGVVGVSWHKKTKSWRAKICDDDGEFHIGVYSSFNDAKEAREKAERSLGYTGTSRLSYNASMQVI